MIGIVDYMKLSLEERKKHIDLDSPCLERGGYSTKFCGVLAEGLNTSIPDKKIDGINVHLCHACNNGKCSNIKHLYWGTPKENFKDTINNGYKNVWENTVSKYGYDTALKMARKQQLKVCVLGGKNSRKNKHNGSIV